MRVAIVHDSLTVMGGAERVLAVLLGMFPEAEVFIPIIKTPLIKEFKPPSRGVWHTAWWSHLPGMCRWADWLKPIVMMYWKTLNLKRFDLIISSSHSFSSKGVSGGKKTVHLSYVHTPPRYLYDEYNHHLFLKKIPWSILFYPLLKVLRRWDNLAASRPDLIVVPSQTVGQRVAAYYHRKSRVIYPPLNQEAVGLDVAKPRNQHTFIFISRLVDQKGVRLVVDAFNRMPDKKLIMIGEGPLMNWVKQHAMKNILIAGYLSDARVQELMLTATALVYASVEEDFGLVPVEAMRCGLPVIGYRSGGVAETVLPGVTGLFYEEYSPLALMKAIDCYAKTNFDRQKIALYAVQHYSKTRFINQMNAAIEELLHGHILGS